MLLALIPATVTLGPPTIVKPLLLKVLAPAFILSTLRLGFRSKLTSLLSVVLERTILPSVLFRSTLSPPTTLLALAPWALIPQPLPNAKVVASNCPTVAASVKSIPAATFVILLKPLSIPLFEIITSPKVALSRLVKSLASLIVKVLFVSLATTPMLLLEARLSKSVSPP